MRWIVALALVGCSAAPVPETHYYALAPPPGGNARGGGATLVVEALAADPPYDDARIVYRSDPYRLDYDEYDRWSAPPGTMIADYLARALAHTGQFQAVLRTSDDASPVTLGGRVDAIEEVDVSKTRRFARVALDLTLTERASGRVLWSQHFEESEPMVAPTPDALARALGNAMERIVRGAAPAVARATKTAAGASAR